MSLSVYDTCTLILIQLFSKCFRIFENGKETAMTYENDVLVSKTINGEPQPLTAS